MINKKLLLALFSVILLSGCKTDKKQESHKETASLKKTFKTNFFIGVALNENQIAETDSVETTLISKEFNSITAENIMKSMYMHPAKDTFYFDLADQFVAFGKKNSMHIVGHTLIWHSQLAPWMAQITDSTEMALAMKNHIETIVKRYKNQIHSWDVVNEALNEDGSLRESVFLKTLGSDYLPLAFQYASEIDKEAKLYYNDYNMTHYEKRQGAIKMIKNLQKKGIKIDGVGLQGHWGLNAPSLDTIEKSILEYSKLNIEVAITELDITVLPNPWDLVGADVNQNFDGSDKMNPFPKQLPDSVQTKLAKRYQSIFKLFLKHQDKISRVTFWGVNDGHSWLNDWPIKNRTNYPLLFDRTFKPKIAYDSIMALKNNSTKQN